MSRHSRVASCRGKAKFGSEESANARLTEIAELDTRGLIPRRAYRCEWCFFWHLTHFRKEPTR